MGIAVHCYEAGNFFALCTDFRAPREARVRSRASVLFYSYACPRPPLAVKLRAEESAIKGDDVASNGVEGFADILHQQSNSFIGKNFLVLRTLSKPSVSEESEAEAFLQP